MDPTRDAGGLVPDIGAGTNPATASPVPSLAGAPAAVGLAPPTEVARPRVAALGPVAWARANLFGSWASTAVTLVLARSSCAWRSASSSGRVVRAVW